MFLKLAIEEKSLLICSAMASSAEIAAAFPGQSQPLGIVEASAPKSSHDKGAKVVKL